MNKLCSTCGAPEGPWLTTSEAAKAIGCSLQTIRNLIGRGELEAIRLVRQFRVRHESVHAYLACHGEGDDGRRRA